MPEDPPQRSSYTPRRSPDVVGSRPPRLDSRRALRRAVVLAVVLAAVALVWVLGRDDEPSPFTGPAAGDPVAALCRSASEQGSSACATAYFACRETRARIVEDAALPRTARPRQIVAAYVKGDWSDWDAGVQDAARRGCGRGLRR